jgi:hypothetical protein
LIALLSEKSSAASALPGSLAKRTYYPYNHVTVTRHHGTLVMVHMNSSISF